MYARLDTREKRLHAFSAQLMTSARLVLKKEIDQLCASMCFDFQLIEKRLDDPNKLQKLWKWRAWWHEQKRLHADARDIYTAWNRCGNCLDWPENEMLQSSLYLPSAPLAFDMLS